MSYLLSPLQRIEALILGTYGDSPYVLESDPQRFKILPDDQQSLEKLSQAVLERTVELVIDPQVEFDRFNQLDGYGIFEHQLTVRVGYQLTDMGDRDSEALDPQNGAGSIRAIRARATTDAHDIINVLTWYGNHDGCDPHIIDISPNGQPSTQISPGACILNIPFRLLVRATMKGNYGS